jgi:phosphotransferase system enzyme I (PtsI)
MDSKHEEIYKGLPASKGISMGTPFVYRVDFQGHTISSNGGEISVDKEIFDYEHAISRSVKELNKVFNLAKEKLDDNNLQIFDAQLSILYDEYFHAKIKEKIKSERKSAFKIFNDEIKHLENALLSSDDDYLRGRASDIEDIKNRILRNLAKEKLVSKITENSIVIARSLTPADTILFSNRNLLGIAIDLGGINSHVSIIARSLNIPAVVGMHDISIKIHAGDFLISDGYKGIVIKNPTEETLERYKQQVKENIEFETKLTDIEKLPSQTKDGKEINLSTNLEFNNEIDYVVTHIGCDVGLYRTEHLFLEIGDFPDEEMQYQQYKLLAEYIYPKTVTIRTFDIGGDKLLPESQKELNPFLGWRGIRICLDKPDIFLTQLRAILRASSKGNVKIMFPMIASLDEVLQAKMFVETAKDQLREKKIKFDEKIEIGIMIEVPASILIADALAKEVSFFSIGTNDLIQYTLAVDRDSSLVSGLYQKFHPAVIKFIHMAVEAAMRNKIPISVCGQLASDPYMSLLLIGLGVNELSVETTSYLMVKRLIRLINYSDAKKAAEIVMKMDTESEIREYLCNHFDKNIGEKLSYE